MRSKISVKDRNWHVWTFLNFYASLRHPPHYAVLIDGPWGIGKTFLVRKFLKENFSEKEYAYVSLYGLSTFDEIDSALLESIYPLLSRKGVKLARRIATAALKSRRFELKVKTKDIMSRTDDRIYIFDDIERCDLPARKILGYINEFVGHEGCKVILVANESEIRNRKEYLKQKEKVVGKTLKVDSSIEEAIDFFISQLNYSSSQQTIRNNIDIIFSIYKQSDLNNLRILQQTMWDFERIFQALAPHQRGKEIAVSALLALFFALSFELRAGRIFPADLKRNIAELSPLAEAAGRYPEVDLNDAILSDEILVDTLVNGIINPDQIRECVERSRYFAVAEREPSWRTVWFALERTDDEFSKAYERMEKQFANREFSVTGEILHVFGLRLWLADIGVSGKSRADVVREGMQYVDDLYVQNRLEPADKDDFDTVRFGGYDGLAIFCNDTDEFKCLWSYLHEKRIKYKKDSYPRLAADLLEEMKSDPSLFLHRITLTNRPENIYYNTPLLAHIEAYFFVSALIDLHPAHQRTIMRALKARYQHGYLDRELAPERNWLRDVRDELRKAAETMVPIAKHRLTTYVWLIDSLIGGDQPAEA